MQGLLRNLIKLCRFSKNESDSAQFPIQQVEYLEKAGDAFVIMPYGTHANIPEDFLGILFQVSTQEQNRAVLPLSSKQRPHPIASGEVVFFHPITGDKIHFKNDGTIDVISKGVVNVTAPNVSVTGAVSITGDVSITGALSVSGDIDGNDVTANNQDVTLSTHLTPALNQPPIPGT